MRVATNSVISLGRDFYIPAEFERKRTGQPIVGRSEKIERLRRSRLFSTLNLRLVGATYFRVTVKLSVFSTTVFGKGGSPSTNRVEFEESILIQ